MGWSSGAIIVHDLITAIKPEVADVEKRKNIYLKLIPAFEQHDWDSQQECMGIDDAFDAALKELHPDWYEEELQINNPGE